MKYPETRLFLLVTPSASYPALWARFPNGIEAVALQQLTPLVPRAQVPVESRAE